MLNAYCGFIIIGGILIFVDFFGRVGDFDEDKSMAKSVCFFQMSTSKGELWVNQSFAKIENPTKNQILLTDDGHVALMAIYMYQNERRMEEIVAKHNQTGSINTAILNSHSVMLQEILKAVRRDNSTIILRDVAHGKPAAQSSVYGVYSAQRAVDGHLNTFMHTNIEQYPYWIVDLGKTYQIKRIEIFNIIDGAKSTGERLHDLDITVGPSHNKMNRCAHYVGPAQVGSHLLFECFNDENARYVRLMIQGTEYLHVAEVKIYAVDDRPS